MDAYGMTIKGHFEVGTDNAYRIGNSGTRLANIYSVLFTGTATKAQYADLAEKYTCREELPVGTVISVSDNYLYEVEACKIDCDIACIGVVSEFPAFLMSSETKGVVTGLTGKIPVRVVGMIHKRDFIVPTVNGCARAGVKGEEIYKIGISLETSNDAYETLVECIIK